MKKEQLTLISVILTIPLIFWVTPVKAGSIKPKSVPCWHFRGEALKLRQTCIYESHSWAGGGVSSLLWKDGVKTTMAWGLQGRGERPCSDWSLDLICGSSYFRYPRTLKRISQAEGRRLSISNTNVIRCIQAGQNSVCWQL